MTTAAVALGTTYLKGRAAKKSAAANRRAQAGIAGGLTNFRPIRVRSGIGELFFGPERIEFQGNEQFKGIQQDNLDFFGNISREAGDFSEQDATASALAKMRALREPRTQAELGRLESRLIGQGRLGLSTGPRDTNPELESFFASERDADIKESLFALGEGRTQRQSLIQSLFNANRLVGETQLPSNLFNAASSLFSGTTGRAVAGAEIQSEATTGFFGTQADARRANIGAIGGALGSLFKKPKK